MVVMASLMKSPITSTNNLNVSLVGFQVDKHEISKVLATKYGWLKRYLDFMSDGGKPVININIFHNLYPIAKCFITNFAHFRFQWIFSW